VDSDFLRATHVVFGRLSPCPLARFALAVLGGLCVGIFVILGGVGRGVFVTD
jgi:hypothetical protein